MDLASQTVLSHDLDPVMIEQIETLRTIRLNLAENMLRDLPRTYDELTQRGLLETVAEIEELRSELVKKIELLRSRLMHPQVIYNDEMSLYLDLVESTENLIEDDL